MKRLTAAFLVLFLILFLIGCGKSKGGKLTIEDIRGMVAEKGEELTWSDFENYSSIETGSGLYILLYEINESYRLMIGGVPDKKPMYIYLVSTVDSDQRIDIRFENIDDFLNRVK